jgi:hypothetical protein
MTATQQGRRKPMANTERNLYEALVELTAETGDLITGVNLAPAKLRQGAYRVCLYNNNKRHFYETFCGTVEEVLREATVWLKGYLEGLNEDRHNRLRP